MGKTGKPGEYRINGRLFSLFFFFFFFSFFSFFSFRAFRGFRGQSALRFRHQRIQVEQGLFPDQRFNDRVETPVQHLAQLVEGQIDAVIGDPPLREIVGADPLGTVATADLQLAVPGLGAGLLFPLRRQQFRLQQ